MFGVAGRLARCLSSDVVDKQGGIVGQEQLYTLYSRENIVCLFVGYEEKTMLDSWGIEKERDGESCMETVELPTTCIFA